MHSVKLIINAGCIKAVLAFLCFLKDNFCTCVLSYKPPDTIGDIHKRRAVSGRFPQSGVFYSATPPYVLIAVLQHRQSTVLRMHSVGRPFYRALLINLVHLLKTSDV
jgi:hypothetical protein